MIAGGTVQPLTYDDDYAGMGWNRQVSITVTLANITGALENIRHSKPNKEPLKASMLYMAIGFAEAIRFDVVISKITKGEAILPADVSWDPGPGTRVLRHDQ